MDPFELTDLKIDELQLYVEFLGGMSPVQGWGTIAERRWLFRARWDRWALEIALQKDVKEIPFINCEKDSDRKYCVEGLYGERGQFDASYMPAGDALEIIKQHAEIFLNKHVENTK